MVLSLSAEAKAAAYRLESYELVDSTNNLAAEFAKSGDAGRLWIIAEQQTSGRGRRGRVWQSPKGNLYATLLLCEGLTAEQTANLGFVAGLALYEALHAVLPAAVLQRRRIKLKWPNDVLADGAKLAGILPEFIRFPLLRSRFNPGAGGGSQTEAAAALIGIGVNIAAAPQAAAAQPSEQTAAAGGELFYPAAALQDSAAAEEAEPLREKLFQALSQFWLENYALWDKGRGMAAIREKWLRGAAYQGELMRLICRGERLDGVFETIDEQGRLVLRRENGARQFISAGDVFFGSVASAAAQS